MEKYPTHMLVVAAALFAQDGRILMHRRPDHKAHGGLWEFPGGKVEIDEAPVNALIRELKEELGLILGAPDLGPVAFCETAAGSANPAIVILLYKSSHWQGAPVSLEGGGVDWFTLNQARQLAKPPLDVQLLEQIAHQFER